MNLLTLKPIVNGRAALSAPRASAGLALVPYLRPIILKCVRAVHVLYVRTDAWAANKAASCTMGRI
jgi:hypothetical protein